ncbi:hypothetical protein CFP56_024612 [Quercus suber]|uniref:Uncharacterized protein n=1 Tax=Quercus suber TaxID=58331 RepID=A0AAW0K6S5_QUESU
MAPPITLRTKLSIFTTSVRLFHASRASPLTQGIIITQALRQRCSHTQTQTQRLVSLFGER